MFISVEGIDGSGKTTAVRYLVETLRKYTTPVVQVQGLGGTPVADEIRQVILKNRINPQDNPSGLTELLLYNAARVDIVEKLIVPALDRGDIVISDRFYDSTFAYQGETRGFLAQCHAIHTQVVKPPVPDFTIYLDVSLKEAQHRLSLRTRAADRLDNEAVHFHQKTFNAFRRRFTDNVSTTKILFVNADGSEEDVENQIDALITDYFLR